MSCHCDCQARLDDLDERMAQLYQQLAALLHREVDEAVVRAELVAEIERLEEIVSMTGASGRG